MSSICIKCKNTPSIFFDINIKTSDGELVPAIKYLLWENSSFMETALFTNIGSENDKNIIDLSNFSKDIIERYVHSTLFCIVKNFNNIVEFFEYKNFLNYIGSSYEYSEKLAFNFYNIPFNNLNEEDFELLVSKISDTSTMYNSSCENISYTISFCVTVYLYSYMIKVENVNDNSILHNYMIKNKDFVIGIYNYIEQYLGEYNNLLFKLVYPYIDVCFEYNIPRVILDDVSDE